MDFEGDFDDLFDMDAYELAFALGMAETIAEEKLERIRIERDFEQDNDDDLLDYYERARLLVPYFIIFSDCYPFY